MHDVIDGRRHLVIAEHRSLPGELEVGREDYGLPLVGFRDDLEERPGTIGVERQEAWLVYDTQLGPADLGELPVEPTLAARVPEAHYEGRGGEDLCRPRPPAGERTEPLPS